MYGPHLRGQACFCGDKSLSHRLVLFSLINRGRLLLKNLSAAADVLTSIEAVKALGVRVRRISGLVELDSGAGLKNNGNIVINCGNSGTTARLLCGILANRGGLYTLVGDSSLSKRPMARVTEPLRAMGCDISSKNGCLPIKINGTKGLTAINFDNIKCSAQVKSAVLLAGLRAIGSTSVSEKFQSRNHTENLLSLFGADIKVFEGKPYRCVITGQKDYFNFNGTFNIASDSSSAAFFAAAAAAMPFSELTIKDLLLNKGRIAYLEVLRRMGAKIEINIKMSEFNEPKGDVKVCAGVLKSVNIGPDEAVALIDELPALGCAMAAAKGVSTVRGASELRIKESDRITGLVSGFKKAGVKCKELADGFEITGEKPLSGGEGALLCTLGDHRLAMAFIMLSLIKNAPLSIDNSECIKISCPEFFNVLGETLVKP